MARTAPLRRPEEAAAPAVCEVQAPRSDGPGLVIRLKLVACTTLDKLPRPSEIEFLHLK